MGPFTGANELGLHRGEAGASTPRSGPGQGAGRPAGSAALPVSCLQPPCSRRPTLPTWMPPRQAGPRVILRGPRARCRRTWPGGMWRGTLVFIHLPDLACGGPLIRAGGERGARGVCIPFTPNTPHADGQGPAVHVRVGQCPADISALRTFGWNANHGYALHRSFVRIPLTGRGADTVALVSAGLRDPLPLPQPWDRAGQPSQSGAALFLSFKLCSSMLRILTCQWHLQRALSS